MTTKDKILRVLWILIAIIGVASIVCLFAIPDQWKGIFLAGSGGFLVFNLLLTVFLIKRNFK
jgi:uncharacterized membrane protein